MFSSPFLRQYLGIHTPCRPNFWALNRPWKPSGQLLEIPKWCLIASIANSWISLCFMLKAFVFEPITFFSFSNLLFFSALNPISPSISLSWLKFILMLSICNDWTWDMAIVRSFNPFVPNAPFLYPLKTCFQVVERGCIGNKWVKLFRKLFLFTKSWITPRTMLMVLESSIVYISQC